jgi:hypothetical protein
MRLLIVVAMLCAGTLAGFAQSGSNNPLIGSGSHGIIMAQKKALACGTALRKCLAGCLRESPRFRPVCESNCDKDYHTCDSSCPFC